MSITLDYFFNNSGSLADVADNINRAVGSSLAPYEGDPDDLFCRFLSLEMSLSTHTLEDDRDCNFSSFRFQLSTRTPVPDADLRDIQVAIMSVIPSVLFRRAGVSGGILVYNTQRLLARYDQMDNRLSDQTVGQPVHLPEHYVRMSRYIEDEKGV